MEPTPVGVASRSRKHLPRSIGVAEGLVRCRDGLAIGGFGTGGTSHRKEPIDRVDALAQQVENVVGLHVQDFA
jgi:hypothetical protein